MRYTVWVDLSDRGMGELVTLDADGNPRYFDTEKEAQEYADLVWPDLGFVKEETQE